MQILNFLSIVLLTLRCTAATEYLDYETYNRLVIATGGEDQFLDALKSVSDRATSLRNGIKNNLEGSFVGTHGLVTQVKFEDGVKWAAKVSKHSYFDIVRQGIEALDAIKQHCPDIPAPRIHGQIESLANSTLIYYFMEWVDGVPLYEDLQFDLCIQHIPCGAGNSSIVRYYATIPSPVVGQLAEFVYNLTTCPITPAEMADLITHGISRPNGNTERIQERNWVKARYIENQNMPMSNPLPENFVGLDTILLMAWIVNKFPPTTKHVT